MACSTSSSSSCAAVAPARACSIATRRSSRSASSEASRSCCEKNASVKASMSRRPVAAAMRSIMRRYVECERFGSAPPLLFRPNGDVLPEGDPAPPAIVWLRRRCRVSLGPDALSDGPSKAPMRATTARCDTSLVWEASSSK